MPRYEIIGDIEKSNEEVPLDTKRNLSLLSKVEIYAKDAPYAVMNSHSKFRNLFDPYEDIYKTEYLGFSHKQILTAAATLVATDTITHEQYEAYKTLFGTRG